MTVAQGEAVRRFRRALEAMVAAGIELMDAMDADGFDREPDGEDEIVSEDDAVVRDWRHVGTGR